MASKVNVNVLSELYFFLLMTTNAPSPPIPKTQRATRRRSEGGGCTLCSLALSLENGKPLTFHFGQYLAKMKEEVSKFAGQCVRERER